MEMRKQTMKSFQDEKFSRLGKQVGRPHGQIAFDLLDEQEGDQCAWKGVSKVVCDTRGQTGELQVGTSRWRGV